MENVKWKYCQYRRNHGYPIYLRYEQETLNSKFVHLFSELGFQELDERETRKINLGQLHARILTIQFASPRLQQLIDSTDTLDQYGHEKLSLQAGTPVYTYRRVGLMGLPLHKTLWDLALNSNISQTEQMVGLRIILVRYLAHALSPFGVVCYWGTVKDDSIVIMKQDQAFGEALLVDLKKNVIFSNGGEIKVGHNLRIIRKDKTFSLSGQLSREELISFLSVSQCLLSFFGMTPPMKQSIYDLSSRATAYFLASETFSESNL